MTNTGELLLSVFFFLALCGAWLLVRLRRERRRADDRRAQLLDTLETAREQFATFDLRLISDSPGTNGLSAILLDVDDRTLHLEVADYVDEAWKGLPVDAFFRVDGEDGPVFYVFRSVFLDISPDFGKARVAVALPETLRVEKKRHFIRVRPQEDAVRVIGVWALPEGLPLPRSTEEIGPPLTHAMPGMAEKPVQVEDISASGLALRFPGREAGPLREIDKGSHLLCLVVYVLDCSQDKTTAFWCTGDVVNVRYSSGPPPARILGVEFTNWAVLEQGGSEIHWSHSSRTRGVRPILQWVERMDKKRARRA
ncbi:PilZ domain-containing protein [uncultured Desulfovibrio sp.]|uniref:PilZ domain-containing protein n=1 Tax=uncultured Desulfovibrio sp. TaxID=167968 RepID=UPI0025E1A337|nr:PilZ domain-containing protein [uncultured Desulfovibrio sp.]